MCPSCNQNHCLSRCEKFRKQSLEERQRFVKAEKLCNNCLENGHFVRACPKQSFCKVPECNGKHSTFLHPKMHALNTTKGDRIESDQEGQEYQNEGTKHQEKTSNAYVEIPRSQANRRATKLPPWRLFQSVSRQRADLHPWKHMHSSIQHRILHFVLRHY